MVPLYVYTYIYVYSLHTLAHVYTHSCNRFENHLSDKQRAKYYSVSGARVILLLFYAPVLTHTHIYNVQINCHEHENRLRISNSPNVDFQVGK